ncbi:hypothetical protein BB561_003692 [Smittium simulii]|uniref:Uncharacterized protein n=1 Tax=Smittium simulii TaxID=133385 RepID=A0A2T9YK17_9FUNG|nr:hypothetical protein BB561_003692 [Smittium simulii]
MLKFKGCCNGRGLKLARRYCTSLNSAFPIEPTWSVSILVDKKENTPSVAPILTLEKLHTLFKLSGLRNDSIKPDKFIKSTEEKIVQLVQFIKFIQEVDTSNVEPTVSLVMPLELTEIDIDSAADNEVSAKLDNVSNSDPPSWIDKTKTIDSFYALKL